MIAATVVHMGTKLYYHSLIPAVIFVVQTTHNVNFVHVWLASIAGIVGIISFVTEVTQTLNSFIIHTCSTTIDVITD